GGGHGVSAVVFTIVKALTKPAKNMVSAITNSVMPMTPLEAIGRRRGGTGNATTSPVPPGIAAEPGSVLIARRLVQSSLDLLRRSDVLPVSAVVLHDVRRHPGEEEHHERHGHGERIG